MYIIHRREIERWLRNKKLKCIEYINTNIKSYEDGEMVQRLKDLKI